jgi:hypothetical protein
MRNILDWLLWIIEIVVLLAHPHISAPYTQIGFIIVLYSRSLLSSESLEFLPINQNAMDGLDEEVPVSQCLV